MKLVDTKITKQELVAIAQERFGDMAKAVVDIDLGIMVIGAGLHADEEAFLIEQGSKQENLWGINIYIDKAPEERIEYDSMINVRPWQNNRSRSVSDPVIQEKIKALVDKLIES